MFPDPRAGVTAVGAPAGRNAVIGLLKTLSELMRGRPLICGQVYLRPPTRGDWREWAALLATKAAPNLEPWEPRVGPRRAHPQGVRAPPARLRRRAAAEPTRGYAFFVFERRGDALVGGVSLSQVRRGVGQSANLGYWTGAPFARRGFMTDALSGLLPLRLRPAGAAPPRRRGARRQCGEATACSKRWGSRARGWRGNICASTASGATMCSTGCCAPTERPFAVAPAPAAAAPTAAPAVFSRQPVAP